LTHGDEALAVLRSGDSWSPQPLRDAALRAGFNRASRRRFFRMNVLAIGRAPRRHRVRLRRHAHQVRAAWSRRLPVGGLRRLPGGGTPTCGGREQQDSATIIGALREVFWGEYPDTEIPLNRELIVRIESVIKKIKPRMILVHFPDDTHQDHRNLAQGHALGHPLRAQFSFFTKGPLPRTSRPTASPTSRRCSTRSWPAWRRTTPRWPRRTSRISPFSRLAVSCANFRGIQARGEVCGSVPVGPPPAEPLISQPVPPEPLGTAPRRGAARLGRLSLVGVLFPALRARLVCRRRVYDWAYLAALASAVAFFGVPVLRRVAFGPRGARQPVGPARFITTPRRSSVAPAVYVAFATNRALQLRFSRAASKGGGAGGDDRRGPRPARRRLRSAGGG